MVNPFCLDKQSKTLRMMLTYTRQQCTYNVTLRHFSAAIFTVEMEHV